MPDIVEELRQRVKVYEACYQENASDARLMAKAADIIEALIESLKKENKE